MSIPSVIYTTILSENQHAIDKQWESLVATVPIPYPSRVLKTVFRIPTYQDSKHKVYVLMLNIFYRLR